MKPASFDDRVAKCIAQFRAVESRSSERSERLGLHSRAPFSRAADQDDTASKV